MTRFICILACLALVPAGLIGVAGCSDDDTPTAVIDEIPPGPVTTLEVALEQNTIVLTWLAPGDDDTSGKASSYDVRYSPSTINPSNWNDASQTNGEPTPKTAGEAERFVVPGLLPDASYYFCLRTRDAAGNMSPLSNVVLLDLDPPAAITDLDIARRSPRSLTLRWHAPSDNDFSGQAVAYDLRSSAQTITDQNWAAADPVPGVPDPLSAGTLQEFEVSGLEPATQTFFAMRSRDVAGNTSAISNVIDEMTLEGGWTGFGTQGTNDQIRSLYSRGTDLVAGGWFTRAGSRPASRIAAWDGQGWSAFGAGMGGSPATVDVSAVIEYGGDLIAGGQFDTAGDITIQNLARWDGSAWQHMLGGTDSYILTMEVYDGKLFVGGMFYQIGGIFSHAIGFWNGSIWSSMAWADYQDVFAVTDLALYDGLLIACGKFTRAGPTPANHIASWNGSSWSAMGDGLTGGEYNSVRCAIAYGGDLIAGGSFQASGTTPIDQLARWDGASWSEFGGGMGSSGADYISDMIEYNGDLIVAGRFTTVGGQAVNHIARWNGSTWDSMLDGVIGGEFTGINALAIHDGSLFVGGNFQSAGGVASSNIARWDDKILAR